MEGKEPADSVKPIAFKEGIVCAGCLKKLLW
jgi:hypothetical protein